MQFWIFEVSFQLKLFSTVSLKGNRWIIQRIISSSNLPVSIDDILCEVASVSNESKEKFNINYFQLLKWSRWIIQSLISSSDLSVSIGDILCESVSNESKEKFNVNYFQLLKWNRWIIQWIITWTGDRDNRAENKLYCAT